MDALLGDWDSVHDSVLELYNGPTYFHFRKHKTDVIDADLECSSYMIAPDEAVGSGSMFNGSVTSKLRGKPALDWDTRKSIAIDAARGLLYLHEQ